MGLIFITAYKRSAVCGNKIVLIFACKAKLQFYCDRVLPFRQSVVVIFSRRQRYRSPAVMKILSLWDILTPDSHILYKYALQMISAMFDNFLPKKENFHVSILKQRMIVIFNKIQLKTGIPTPEPSRDVNNKNFKVMTQQEWSKTTSAIFYGVMIFSLTGIVNSILSPIENAISGVSALKNMGSGNFGGGSGGILSLIVDWIAPVAIIVGYVLYLIGLSGFKKLLGGSDGSDVGKIYTGVILALIGIVAAWIPVIGGVAGGILGIIGFILAMLGYSGLKSSVSFPEDARKGASKLFTAQILLIIGWFIGLIPLVGGFIEAVLGIIAFILILNGWAKIKNVQVETV
jgi:hypothetical protein